MSHRNELCVPIQDLPPEGLEWRGKIPFAALDINDDERFSFLGSLSFDLRVSPVQTKILVQGHLEGRLRGRCDCCLNQYEAPVATDEVCHSLEVANDAWLDLTEDIREDILVALPNRSLCREGCRGLCPACGGDLNVARCSCGKAAASSSPWTVLDTLQLPQRED